jgi:hypothetical protein
MAHLRPRLGEPDDLRERFYGEATAVLDVRKEKPALLSILLPQGIFDGYLTEDP